jgi:hypothetical protein
MSDGHVLPSDLLKKMKFQKKKVRFCVNGWDSFFLSLLHYEKIDYYKMQKSLMEE